MPPVRDSITVKKGRHALPAECLFPVQLALCGHVFRTVGPFSHSYNESLTGLGSGLRALSLPSDTVLEVTEEQGSTTHSMPLFREKGY